MVDTGTRTGVLLAAPFVRENGLVAALPGARHGTIGGGFAGEARGWIGRGEHFVVEGHRVLRPVVILSTDTGGAMASTFYDGLIGAEWLRRHRVFLDWPEAHP